MIPTLQARVSEMHGVLNQVLYNVKRISEHLSIQPPSAHVRPQVQQQMMGFSRRENMESTGLSQSMTGLGYEGFMQEMREAEDRVEKCKNTYQIFSLIFFLISFRVLILQMEV